MSQFHLFAVEHATRKSGIPAYEVFVEVDHRAAKDGRILVTSGCQSGADVDRCIDTLITQLNAVRHKAKEKLGDSIPE